ncbi:MAG: acyl-CoA thioesterase [Saprospiraceae bacterium]|jgi:acyl-CoA thioester hydrolase|nr:acyl-CoA thioesterase [Saprospiraceae bacterium]HRD83378.1 thioesterase family protein [Saprospiraceae bacterium]HRJ15876.1 thioesterase family protein [Saprospiraceae bacterium]HRK83144.1 thioesterase family protein [Saprospiraceae bacterium]
MLIHEFQKRVRYGETDQMGYLYYGNYAQYYEIGRVEMLRASGLTYREMEQERGVLMPVVSLQMRYVRPAYYDELLTIRTTLRRLPEKFITFEVEIFNENRKLVNGGSVRLCFVDAKSGKTIAAPEFLLEKLRAHFEKAPTT